jgi:hypothetical protein
MRRRAPSDTVMVARLAPLRGGDAAVGLLLCGAAVVRSVDVCAMERKVGGQGEVNRSYRQFTRSALSCGALEVILPVVHG